MKIFQIIIQEIMLKFIMEFILIYFNQDQFIFKMNDLIQNHHHFHLFILTLKINYFILYVFHFIY